MDVVFDWASAHLWWVAGALGAVLVLGTLGYFAVKAVRDAKPSAAQLVATLAALVSTGVGANTAWRFAGDRVHITAPAERAGLFLAGEILLLGLALMARSNLNNPAKQAAGLPGVLVWCISLFLVVPAISESTDPAGNVNLAAAAWRAVLGPIGAAVMWHLAMGLELRQARPDAENRGFLAVLLRRFQQQVLSLLGVAEKDQNAEQIARDRALRRAADLVDRFEALPEKARTKRRGRRMQHRLKASLRTAGVAHLPGQWDRLMAELAVSKHAAGLAGLEHAAPWQPAAVEPPVVDVAPGEDVAAAPAYLPLPRTPLQKAADTASPEHPDHSEREASEPPAAGVGTFHDDDLEAMFAALAIETEDQDQEPALWSERAGYGTAPMVTDSGDVAPDARPDHVDDEDQGQAEPAEPAGPGEPEKLGTEEAAAMIRHGWASDWSQRRTARAATRSAAYVGKVYKKLDSQRA